MTVITVAGQEIEAPYFAKKNGQQFMIDVDGSIYETSPMGTQNNAAWMFCAPSNKSHAEVLGMVESTQVQWNVAVTTSSNTCAQLVKS